MEHGVDHDILNDALQRCGASWDAAQSHGLLTGRLAIAGAPAGPEWLQQILEGTDERSALTAECRHLLDTLYQTTYWQLTERLSEFVPLLPDDDAETDRRTLAMAHWCEGFLHGLVSGQKGDAIRDRLAAEPLADIIRDMLQITRAEVDADADEEGNEAAYTELVEYLRVAAQLAYEELADLRNGPADASDTLH